MPYYDVQMTVCLPFAACRVYFSKMAMALKWLHDNYITHNDIKLANTLVKHSAGDRYGQPVLVGESHTGVPVDSSLQILSFIAKLSCSYISRRFWIRAQPRSWPRNQFSLQRELGNSRVFKS